MQRKSGGQRTGSRLTVRRPCPLRDSRVELFIQQLHPLLDHLGHFQALVELRADAGQMTVFRIVPGPQGLDLRQDLPKLLDAFLHVFDDSFPLIEDRSNR